MGRPHNRIRRLAEIDVQGDGGHWRRKPRSNHRPSLIKEVCSQSRSQVIALEERWRKLEMCASRETRQGCSAKNVCSFWQLDRPSKVETLLFQRPERVPRLGKVFFRKKTSCKKQHDRPLRVEMSVVFQVSPYAAGFLTLFVDCGYMDSLLLVVCVHRDEYTGVADILHIVTALRVCEIQMGLFSVAQRVTPRCCCRLRCRSHLNPLRCLKSTRLLNFWRAIRWKWYTSFSAFCSVLFLDFHMSPAAVSLCLPTVSRRTHPR